MNINYRLLNVDEWDRLREIYPDAHELPSPATSSVAVAERDGKLVGALFMQLTWHMEPLIRTDKSADYKELATKLTEMVPKNVPYFSRVPDEKMGHIARQLGMVLMDEQLYMGTGGE